MSNRYFAELNDEEDHRYSCRHTFASRFVELGLLKDVGELYYLTKKQLVQLEGLSAKSYRKHQSEP